MTTENTPLAGTEKITLPPHLRKPRLRRDEAVEYLKLKHGIDRSVATLAKWAVQGIGPKYDKLNRTPVYPTVNIDAWVEEMLVKGIASTSEG